MDCPNALASVWYCISSWFTPITNMKLKKLNYVEEKNDRRNKRSISASKVWERKRIEYSKLTEKKCSLCLQIKEIEKFDIMSIHEKSQIPRRHNQCHECYSQKQSIYQKQYREEKKIKSKLKVIAPPLERECKICHVTKNAEAFPPLGIKTKKGRDPIHNWCRECVIMKQKEYYNKRRQKAGKNVSPIRESDEQTQNRLTEAQKINISNQLNHWLNNNPQFKQERLHG